MSPTARFYLSSNPIHNRVITALYDGCPENKQLCGLDQYEPSDIAVIFGIYKSKVPISWPRGEIIRQQRQNNLDVIVLETGYINRGDGENHHYAAGFNGLNGRADFRNRNMPPDRSEKLGVELKPWKAAGEAIILCGQIPWDASVDHVDFMGWLENTQHRLMSLTTRPIVFRPHPLVALAPLSGCEYSQAPLGDDLRRAWACVTFNSNSAVEAAIAGVPVFVDDEGSMAWRIANLDLNRIEFPQKPERQQWLNDLCYTQWTPDEMAEGLAWKHLFRSHVQ